MAKIVIAGKSNCPYYAKAELLADKLASSVDAFNVHKIVKTPSEWEQWIESECQKRKFDYKKSPVVWRELVDRGGKGILIGGANEFQEYAWGYYGIKSPLQTSDVKKIADENIHTKEEVDKELAYYKGLSKPMKICITNAGSPVSYHLMTELASGEILGQDNELTIHLLSFPDQTELMNGLKMEMEDLAHNLLRNVVVTTDQKEALRDCEVVIMLDELSRNEEESEDAWLRRNADMFVDHVKVIDDVCKPNVKVLLAGLGPINTAAYMMAMELKNIGARNIITAPRLVENQAKALLARKLKVKTSDVVDVIVWGDNENYFCDTLGSRVHSHDGPIWGPPFYSRVASLLIHDEQWLATEFAERLRSRMSVEEEKMKHSPCFSRAAAITTLLQQWCFGSPSDQIVTLGLPSEGWYDVPEGMVFNFPARFSPSSEWTVVDDLELSDQQKSKIKESVDYLMEQRYQLFPDQRPPPPPTPKPEDSDNAASGSPHPPPMTPIKEETDLELKPSEGAESSAEQTDTQSDSEPRRTTSTDPTLEKIPEGDEGKEEQEDTNNHTENSAADDAPPPADGPDGAVADQAPE